MNEKTFQLLEFNSILANVAACAVSEEAEKIILNERPLLDADEAENLKSLVASVATRFRLIGAESRASFPSLGGTLPKLDVLGMALEIEEAYAIGIFVERATAFKQWLLKPLPGANSGINTAGANIGGNATGGNTVDTDQLSAHARELPCCAEVASCIFKVLDRDGNLRDLPEFREIRKRIRSIQKDI